MPVPAFNPTPTAFGADPARPDPIPLYVGDVWEFDVVAVDRSGAPSDFTACAVGAEIHTFASPLPIVLDPACCAVQGDPKDGYFTVTVPPEVTSAVPAENGLRPLNQAWAGRDFRRPGPDAQRTRLVTFYTDALDRPHTIAGPIPILPLRR